MIVGQEGNRIQALSPLLIDRIAAGEVIEGPSSVIKELIENSLDAKADNIHIETKAAGLEQITLQDNGMGIHTEDMEASILRHATSKISSLQDIEKLSSFGFRGEALAAIASVSHLEIKSGRKGEKIGCKLSCRGGEVLSKTASSHAEGTTITVSNLFYSTPARRKYLKSPRTENIKNYKEITRLAIANSHIAFNYFRDNKEFAAYPAQQSLEERLRAIYNPSLLSHLIDIKSEHMGISLSGYVSSPEYYRANREGQFSFVNNRPVEIKNFSAIVRKAYEELLGPGSYPYFFLFVEIDPSRLDPNVHPQKKEVRLIDQSALQSLLFNSISKALRPNTALNLAQTSLGLDKLRQDSSLSKQSKIEQSFRSSQGSLIEKGLQVSPAYLLDLGEKRLEANKKDFRYKGLLPQTKQTAKTYYDSPYHSHSRLSNHTDVPDREKTSFSPQFSFLRHFGTVLGTYIVAEDGKNLYIIDQHTAHERVNYEKNLAKLKQTSSQRQGLLTPLLVNCLSDELERIMEAKDMLLQNGFLIEASGPKSYLIREIPPYLELGSEIDVCIHLIQRLLEAKEEGLKQQEMLYKEYAAMRACKASIKKNDQVSEELLAEVLRDLPKCKEPGRCPHGRPTLFQISLQELDRIFKR